jgi:hypothetical protein
MTAETLSTEVFHCMHCDRFGLPFVRDATGKFYRFPPTIGATGPAPLLFVGINPRVSASNRVLHDAIVHNHTRFEELRRNRVGTREYIGRDGLERHYALHVDIAHALFPGNPFDSVACVTELHLCASTSSVGLPFNSSECAGRYFGSVLEVVRPVVIFAVGIHVERTLRARVRTRRAEFDMTWQSGRAPVVTLPHPNSFGPKREGFDRAVSEAKRHLGEARLR